MLELRGITAGYGTHTVLRDVNLVVPDNSVVALLGPNGAGKTTLLRVASGLLAAHGRPGPHRRASTPPAGRRTACPSSASATSPRGGASSGRCRSRTTSACRPRPAFDGDPIRAVAEAFPRLGERLAQRAGTMSGGEQQMLALARAYVAGANTVLLDEVSMGLAPKIIDEIFEYLHRLAAQGAALLLVEQYVARALELAEFVYILNKGRVQFVGESARARRGADPRLVSGGLT